MKIGLIVLVTLIIDGLLGYFISWNKNRQLKRDEDLFIFKLEQILNNKNATGQARKNAALELCRNTKGKIAAGAYFALGKVELLN